MEGFRRPTTLKGHWIRLVPLELGHAESLRRAARDPESNRFMLQSPGTTLADLEGFIAFVLAGEAAGTDLGFTTVLNADDRPVGMTRYLHIDRRNRSVEIGGTWVDPLLWRTPVNTESKFLLLRHAFETEQFHRVCLQTDLRNVRAQRSIERLGAVREAEFRDDKLLPDGRFRTSVFYGILLSEWPKVKADLERKLAQPWSPSPDPGVPP